MVSPKNDCEQNINTKQTITKKYKQTHGAAGDLLKLVLVQAFLLTKFDEAFWPRGVLVTSTSSKSGKSLNKQTSNIK